MVKLGSNLSDKLEKRTSVDDGFDNIPLITPLEVNQLQQSFAEKVIVRTTAQYKLQQQESNKLFVPSIKNLNIKLYDGVSDKIKITGLILITLAFLTSVLLLMHKAMRYDQLTCPDGFILKQQRCTLAAVETYYTDSQQQQEKRERSPPYAALSHLTQAERAGPELPQLWLPVIAALKEAEQAKQVSQ